MGDAVRPADDTFNRVLQESFRTWSSYLASEDEDYTFPQRAIDLRSLVCQTPPFLGGSTAASDEKIAFACEEKQSTQGKGSLVVNAQSTWRTSTGDCDLPPRVLSKQLLLAVGHKVTVRLSTDSPFSHWSGVHGLSGYDEGNYLSLLYLTWAYILSARWVELLGHSVNHDSQMSYTAPSREGSVQWHKQQMFEVDIGDDACEEEVLWWRAILCSDNGWAATTKYNGHEYLSPWSLSATDTGLTLATKMYLNTRQDPPDSTTALKYLSRFCIRHRIYAQCSVALAGVLYIPFLSGRTIYLPYPKQIPRSDVEGEVDGSTVSIPLLISEHGQLLAQYMALSSNVWGLRSILYSTFFNKEIECNLVSAWLNPAFAILDSISSKSNSKAAFLINRQPRIGILWLGAILTDLAKPILRDIRSGMTALDLPASAWTGTIQTFLTSKIDAYTDQLIRRDDECRLLFITASEGHDRPPVWTWKPFGATWLWDTELPARNHARCGDHSLEYKCWEWILENGYSIRNPAVKASQPPYNAGHPANIRNLPVLDHYTYNFFSQAHSEEATRGIFGWLRSTGYPGSERPIYEHAWIDIEGTDDEEATEVEDGRGDAS